ncbi:MAG: phosphotransferase [Candidatus Eisenbacteria bacterium]|jgi:Ser/Thr protein kinase RdoA (MazF antagonist)|nr:phosphotransferase [Candidatus Eisenbacteria bacterium]
MDKRIKARFNQAILREAMQRFGIGEESVHELGGFESFIYEFSCGSESHILRIGHGSRRSENLVHGEVDWINYLAREGVSVARAAESARGKLVESLDDGHGGQFLATAFVKAQGEPPWQAGWSPELYRTYGRLIGRMHRLTKDYLPPCLAWKRPEWDDAEIQDIEANLPSDQALVIDRYWEVRSHLGSLVKGRDDYGLIHFDAHGSNMLVDSEGRITLFDFDDCSYGWFAYDIAIVLFYMITNRPDATSVCDEFMPRFLEGYRVENRLDSAWLREIPWFLKLREIDLYAVIHRSFDVDRLTDSWVSRFMQGRRGRIEQAVPYVEYDFPTLAAYL